MKKPLALTIAGSDCSAGAGIQADLKTFSALDVHGLTAITCVVAETPRVVTNIHPLPPSVLQDQVRLMLESYPVGAVKTGMLYSKSHIVAIYELLAECSIPIIVDPVMVASTGDLLLAEDALEAMSDRLLPLASVITPNLPEAEVLLGRSITLKEEFEEAARELASKYETACYLKGGHLSEGPEHTDILVAGDLCETFSAPHVELVQTHGTGCTLAAALTASLAKGESLTAAAKRAHEFTQAALQNSLSWISPTSGEEIWHLDQVQY